MNYCKTEIKSWKLDTTLPIESSNYRKSTCPYADLYFTVLHNGIRCISGQFKLLCACSNILTHAHTIYYKQKASNAWRHICIWMTILLHVNFFWQGLTGGDGHQQRTDYVISTKATPGRYGENNYSIQFLSGTHIWHRVVVDHGGGGGGSFFWIMNLSLARMFCAQVVHNTIISCCTCGKIF